MKHIKFINDNSFIKKYGKNGSVLCKKIYKQMYYDTLYETGNIKKAYFEVFKTKLKYKYPKELVQSIIAIYISISAFFHISTKLISSDNRVKYEKEIEEYNNYIKKYAEEIKKLDLNDLDTFMIVINDMWNQIDGYGNPLISAVGYQRLDILNGVGVCRNMSDDVAHKLNLINPEYNARVLYLYASYEKGYEINDIDIKYSDSYINQINNSNNSNNSNDDFRVKLFGNHAVVIVNIPNKCETIILDPTNPSVGVLKNGKIYMFNANDGKCNNITLFGIYMSSESKDIFEFAKDLMESYNYSISVEELNDEYGLESQNKSIEKIKKLKN